MVRDKQTKHIFPLGLFHPPVLSPFTTAATPVHCGAGCGGPGLAVVVESCVIYWVPVIILLFPFGGVGEKQIRARNQNTLNSKVAMRTRMKVHQVHGEFCMCLLEGVSDTWSTMCGEEGDDRNDKYSK